MQLKIPRAATVVHKPAHWLDSQRDAALVVRSIETEAYWPPPNAPPQFANPRLVLQRTFLRGLQLLSGFYGLE